MIMYMVMRILPDKWAISLDFYRYFGKLPDFKNPKTFNEKLQWLKLYNRKPEYTMMVDKYAVKEYVAGIIGAEYIKTGSCSCARNLSTYASMTLKSCFVTVRF